jgi:type IV pilus assembly protein PilV
MQNLNIIHSKNSQQGILLIEVMLAILIFSFGILGLVGLQVIATQNSLNAENRTRASLLANELVSQMWLNKTTSLPSSVVTAWSNRVASSDATLNTYLPNAAGSVVVNATTAAATVTVTWKDTSKKASDSNNLYQTTVTIP